MFSHPAAYAYLLITIFLQNTDFGKDKEKIKKKDGRKRNQNVRKGAFVTYSYLLPWRLFLNTFCINHFPNIKPVVEELVLWKIKKEKPNHKQKHGENWKTENRRLKGSSITAL
jgi:hypothetical protein